MEDRDFVLVNKVEENREGFSHRERSGAKDYRQALSIFSYPSQKHFDNMVRSINNFPVTIEDVRNSNTIYGCNAPILKVKTVRQQPNCVQAEYIEVPDRLWGSIGKLIVADDVVFVNGIPFVVSVLTEVISQRWNMLAKG